MPEVFFRQMKLKTKKLNERVGISITERRGRWRVKLGIKVTGDKPIDRLVESEEVACELVEYYLKARTNRTQAAYTLDDNQLEDAFKAFELLKEKSDLSLTEIARKYLESLPASKSITVEKLTDLYYKLKSKQGLSPNYLNSLRYFSRPLSAHLGSFSVHEVQAHHLEDYLEDVHGLMKPKTYNNHLGYIKGLWAIASKRKMIVEDVTEHLEKRKTVDQAIGILKPHEIQALIEQAQEHDPELVILLALQAFAGLRRSEACGLTWDDIQEDAIVIQGTISKTGARRVVPILPPLKSLLESYQGMHKDSLIYTAQINNLQRRRARLVKRAGITWKHNALRHSFVSYRLADLQDDNQVALEAGHSVSILHRHYKQLVTNKKDIVRYWELFTPEDNTHSLKKCL